MLPTDPKTPAIFQRLDQSVAYPYSTREYAARLLWQIVQATLIRFSLPRAYNWRRFLLRLFGARMGDFSAIRPTTRIQHPWLLHMDHRSMLSDGVVIYNLGPVFIGQHSIISQDTYLCAGTHDYTKTDLPLLRPPIRIGHGVWIAAHAFIGPGVTIGDNSVIGARAVVVSDIPPAVVAAGNPAKVIKPRSMNQSPTPQS